jgi:uncharacterized repeat protein (TIGR01451 family)
MKRSVCVAISMLGLLVVTPSAALAHQSPLNCNKNGIALNVQRSQALVKNGDSITYTVSVANDATGSCDITNTTIDLILPAADGTPTGQRVRIVTGASYPAGFSEVTVGTVPYTVALNKGVTAGTVRAIFVNATLHDNPNDTSLAGIFKDIGLFMTPPTINITKSASPTSGPAPLTVTYTYTVTNTSILDLPVKNVTVSDNLCPSATYASGDSDGDGALDVNEAWVFRCTTTHANPGTYVDTASACGDGVLGGEHVCTGPVQATVVVTPPPPPPPAVNVPVVNASTPNKAASTPSTCFSVPKTLTLRAKEVTTVKVSVTTGTRKGAKITIKGPGFTKKGTTDSKGVVTFKVTPTKSGTLTVTSDRCLQVAKASVKAAHQTQSRQLPKNTG